MMQIHPPPSISLLSEMFNNSNNNNNNNNGASNADGENSTDDRNGKLPQRTPTLSRSRTEIADHPSFAMRPSSSSRRAAEPTSGPITCFSYRTMEKEYEKDTLRMLERIRRSRSFDRKDPVATRSYRPWNSCHLPDGSTTPAAAADDDDDSSSSSSDGGGFYIGDDSLDATTTDGGFGWCDHGSGSEPPSLTLLGSCGNFDDDVISDDGEEEIFELDL
mmetsp:Transcript_2064/g.5455  ORF Transcript_2064/g.5455 Transcript_2064/m.5455 type:complete len:218 (+) Transcript_2064:548-1201(+)|eukprot:CAMPEP_0197180804 /NCGR_PEP_ID=MMETSP1423-20130617/5283_1 /TAXON_ID=476441 /ORGANISM="Pseudo-nitzschia heimii, Strain UNC1101" /LENGTH=217 /DNA_ID=CAMNT_0042630929 /DNA_START=517 /DNA_END=1170 /DNA_ORIENTATION=+